MFMSNVDEFESFNLVMGHVYRYRHIKNKLNVTTDDAEKLDYENQLIAIAIQIAACDSIPGNVVNLTKDEFMLLYIPGSKNDMVVSILGKYVNVVHLGSLPHSTSYFIFNNINPMAAANEVNVGNPRYFIDYKGNTKKSSVSIVNSPVQFIIKYDDCAHTGGNHYITFRGCVYYIHLDSKAMIKDVQKQLTDITYLKPVTDKEIANLPKLTQGKPALVISFNLWKIK